MDCIIIKDLEVWFKVGVAKAERAKPQRLLLTIEMRQDFAQAAAADDLSRTIDYYAVTQRLQKLGQGKTWKLIETLASEIARVILQEFHPQSVVVEVKKFIMPETQWVAVRTERVCPGGGTNQQ
jgi:FolB domain-containing protein